MELEEIYFHEVGLRADDEVITYCRIGERSSHSWFALTFLLGMDRVRNYDGSCGSTLRFAAGEMRSAPRLRGHCRLLCQTGRGCRRYRPEANASVEVGAQRAGSGGLSVLLVLKSTVERDSRQPLLKDGSWYSV